MEMSPATGEEKKSVETRRVLGLTGARIHTKGRRVAVHVSPTGTPWLQRVGQTSLVSSMS